MRYVLFFFSWLFLIPLQSQEVFLAEQEMGEPGRHYRFPEFEEGKIFRDGNPDPTEALLNYNLITEEMVIDLGHSKSPFRISDDILKISLGTADFIPIDGKIYEVLYQGKIPLLTHRKMKVDRLGQDTGLGRTTAAYASGLPPELKGNPLIYELALPAKYDLKDLTYHYLKKDDELIQVRNLKKLLDIFPELKNELKSFIKKEGLKSNREEDLIKAVEFCNK